MKKLYIYISGLLTGILLCIGTMTVAANSDLVAKIYNKKIFVDGVELKLENKPLLVQNSTYLPLRSFVEGLGYKIETVDNNQITLSTKIISTKSQESKSHLILGSEYVKNLYELISTDSKIDLDKIKNTIFDNQFTINVQDEETGYSLYHYAVLNNDINLYSYLKANKANASLQDNTGKTPLHHAVIEDNNLFIGLLTSEIGVPTKIKDNDGKMPIDYAEKNSPNERRLKNYKE